MTDFRALLTETYRAALAATDAGLLVRAHLPAAPPALIVSVGKASLPMLGAALSAYPGAPFLAVAPDGPEVGAAVQAAADRQQGEILYAGHPVPDQRSVRAAERFLEQVGTLAPGDELLVLISGGSSALLCAPWGLTLEQKQALTRELLGSGASIQELNTVRKHVSRIKGGRLAQVAQARQARVTALLLSDVIGDDPSVIASGPTVPDPTTFADALKVLERYGVQHSAARAHLKRGARGELNETPKAFHELRQQVIGSNRLLLDAAAQSLEARGIPAVILGDTFGGEARELAAMHAALVRSVRGFGTPVRAPVALLSGGEATVTVRGSGVGGRNHEFALALLLELGERGLWALSVGSDGVDGSAAAAGAFLTPDSWQRARHLGLDLQTALHNNDSGTLFAALGDALITGPTGQNLNDLRILLIGPD
ncbi:glycerate kinase (plasmid) [Deinococcus sp. KNUC1210]|uniref:glycerate kinase type-2 family protein n=1 Tax=Deinococcus sp. KNUC1210 TaxID=2917691 RepID=UPI001EF0DD77|nr:glycerate kinase [Deinococcus sp. KNUC1210]ULH14159.1 glycerate kinase [Deinococcus sp. KNUC1210]